MYYRGYILIRLKKIGTEWKVVEKLTGLKSKESEEDWKITYATPIYGGWDVIVECSFSKLKDLDKIVTFCRVDEELSLWIEETTTLMGSKNDFPG
ncbi:hypothetical protein LCGC14_0951030 [marine sediment metagenome]|uniref:Transcription regulator AsnC/Lrp ligand binding domain-containing protein n=1 Tax=marine sediment metagenome TaxID=412755 RepID=A0A0F9P3D9_9ZZZZ